MTRRVLLRCDRDPRCYHIGEAPGVPKSSDSWQYAMSRVGDWNGVTVTKKDRWDFLKRRVLLRCDSTGDLYPVTAPSPIPNCDHGGEFDNRTLHKLFADNGIQFRFSCPKTSQQNVPSYTFLDEPDINPPSVFISTFQLPVHEPTTPPTSLTRPAQSTITPIIDGSAHTPITPHLTQSTDHVALSSPNSAQHAPTIMPNPLPLVNPNPDLVHHMVTRFRVGTNRPVERLTLHVSSVSHVPRSYHKAFNDVNWHSAMRDEYNALIKNSTWTLVPRPPDVNVVQTQLEGVDVDDTFSPPPGFRDFTHPDYVCLLQHSLYGLKQAFRAWFQRFASYITKMGFHYSRCDNTLFIFHQGNDTAYLLLYVDDIMLTVSSSDLLHRIIRSLHQEFAMIDLGSLNYLLGISVTRDSSGMFLSQKKYVVEILKCAGMVHCNPSRTPVDTESKLGATGDVVSDSTLYRSLAGSLQYLTFTRPDISYAVQQLFSSSTTDLVAYSDADWAGCPTTRRSTSGYCVFLGNNLLSWSAKRQPTLSRSSAEAEYRGVANVVAETCWLRNLLRELHTPLSSATLVYCDNVSAVYLSSNPVQHQRTKHIEIDIHFVRDLVATGQVRVLHVPSRYQFADIFTKGLPTALFEEFRFSLSVRCPPAQTDTQTAGEC
ncbi:ribonuclease H-like domain-containing protein [Tanacetum coccineum]